MNIALTIYVDSFGVLRDLLEKLPEDIKTSTAVVVEAPPETAASTVSSSVITASQDVEEPAGEDQDQDDEPVLDADGTVFDANLHAWNKDTNSPSLTATGKFRKKRTPKKSADNVARAGEATPRETGPEPDPETPTDQDVTEPEPETYSNVLRSMLNNINASESAVALNRIENHPVLQQLPAGEKQIATRAIRDRADALIEADNCD
jgi:hypothetical protein